MRRPTRRPTAALATILAPLVFSVSAADAAESSKQRIDAAEARTATRQALTQTADLIDARKVAVGSCRVRADRARCRAVIRGTRQTLRATVAVRELPATYVVRVLWIG